MRVKRIRTNTRSHHCMRTKASPAASSRYGRGAVRTRYPCTGLAIVLLAGGAAAVATSPTVYGRIEQSVPAGSCRISGRAMAAAVPLPGVAIVVRAGDAVKAATSTDTDGTYRVNVPPGAYDVTAELMGFDTSARTLNVPQEAVAQSCVQTINFPMALAPRAPRAASAPATPVPGPAGAPPQGRGAVPSAPAATRFATLNVQTQAAAAAGNRRGTATARRACCFRRGFPPKGRPRRSPSTATWQASIAG